MFVFLRVSSVVLAFSFWFEFILFHVAVFYLRLSSVVESSLSDPSIIYCFCCISHLSSGVFCCHFLLVSYCIQFVPCSCRLSSIASCHCIFVFLLKKAFIVFPAVFVFLRVSSVVLALSYWFEFILFYVAVFYLRLPSSVVESSLSDPSIIYCFCCISHLSPGVFCCHFLLVSNCIHSLLCSCHLSSIASCHCIFVFFIEKSIYCICCGVCLSSGVFCCPRVVILIWVHFVLCSCLLSSIVFCRWIFVVWSKYHLLFLLHFSSFFGCLLLSLPPRFELCSFSSMQLSFTFDCLLSLHLRFVIEKSI